MTKGENMLERLAQVIAEAIGYQWNTLYEGKQEWTFDRGSRHDINVPYKPDFREAASAVMDELWSRVDLALLDFAPDDPEGFARGHEHAKSVVRRYLRTASIPNEEGSKP